MSGKVAVVTGGNRGIGLAVVRGLCAQFSGDVLLTARDEGRGRAAVDELKKEGLTAKFHQLDLNDLGSGRALGEHLAHTYGGLDVLVNNAGIMYGENVTEPFSEQAEMTIKVNYSCQRDITNILAPLLRPGARVVNMSSMAAKFAWEKCSDDVKKMIKSATAEDEVDALMNNFVSCAQCGTLESVGWPRYPYGVSKIGLNKLTDCQHAAFSSRDDIIVNSCTPGWVKTALTSYQGNKTPEEGADTPLYLALLPPGATQLRGQFVRDRVVDVWDP